MGTCPPELEILEIGDLAEDRFRGIFKMRYHGDAEIVLQTKVQVNCLFWTKCMLISYIIGESTKHA